MPAERLTLDPIRDNVANAPMELVEASGADVGGVSLLEHDYGNPDPESLWGAAADTEGDPLIQNRYPNRAIELTLRVAEPQDGASTNLATNPDGAADTTGWAGVSLVSGPTRVVPAAPAQIVGADTAVQAVTDAASDLLYLDAAVTNGTTYRFSCYVQLVANSATGVRVCVYNAAGAVKKATGVTTLSAMSGTAWTRLDVAVTADATATWRFGVEQVGAGGTLFQVAGMLVEASATLGNYFDGDTPGCAWSGSRNGSSSTRPASGGPRFYAILGDLGKKVDRINREGGVLRRVVPDGDTIMFDLRSAKMETTTDRRSLFYKRAEVKLTFVAAPFGRGYETLSATFDETTLPANVFRLSDIPGDVPALGRLILTELQGVDQWRVTWGLRSKNDSTSADAALFYEAETRTALNGAANAALAGASNGNAILSAVTQSTKFTAIMSTQASGGGNHLSHVGSYRVMVRVKALNPYSVLAFDYGDGSLIRRVQLPEVTPETWGDFALVDFGVIRVQRGRWEGRVLLRSNSAGWNAQVNVDCLFLFPVDEGAGEIGIKPQVFAPASVDSSALMNQTAFAALTGQAAEKGGNWTWLGAPGDADDFYSSGSGVAYRVAISDGATFPTNGRILRVGSSTLTDTVAQVDLSASSVATDNIWLGIAFRIADASNFCIAAVQLGGTSLIQVAGVGTGAITGQYRYLPALAAGVTYTMTVYCDRRGRVAVWLTQKGAQLGDPVLQTQSSVLATGGGRASGYCGLFDYNGSGTTIIRTYDNWQAWAPNVDAALYANRDAQIGPNYARRRDSGGVILDDAPYEGDYLLIPPAGPEKRTAQFIVKGSRGGGSDTAIDDLRAQVGVTPRWFVVPST